MSVNACKRDLIHCPSSRERGVFTRANSNFLGRIGIRLQLRAGDGIVPDAKGEELNVLAPIRTLSDKLHAGCTREIIARIWLRSPIGRWLAIRRSQHAIHEVPPA